jgi:hypothetical protein
MVSASVLGNPDAQVWEMLRLAPYEDARQESAQAECEAPADAEFSAMPRIEKLDMCLL